MILKKIIFGDFCYIFKYDLLHQLKLQFSQSFVVVADFFNPFVDKICLSVLLYTSSSQFMYTASALDLAATAVIQSQYQWSATTSSWGNSLKQL